MSRTNASISDDGRFVAFESNAADIVPSDGNGVSDVFVRDLRNATTKRVSVSGTNTELAAGGRDPSISGNGRYVAFASGGNVFRRALATHKTLQISVGRHGAPPDDNSFAPSISRTGQFVAFQSAATNLTRHESQGKFQIYVRDVDNARTRAVSISALPMPQQRKS